MINKRPCIRCNPTTDLRVDDFCSAYCEDMYRVETARDAYYIEWCMEQRKVANLKYALKKLRDRVFHPSQVRIQLQNDIIEIAALKAEIDSVLGE